MAADDQTEHVEMILGRLRRLQVEYGGEIDVVHPAVESPAKALDSLEDAVAKAPAAYRPYLQETVGCYRHGLYRAAILMTWSATVQHLYVTAGDYRGGISKLEKANKERFGEAKKYRRIKKQDDLSYLGERDFITLCEDAGMCNRNTRQLLHQRLETRNLCGHPTGYTIGREETVVFIESLLLNVLSGSWLNWSPKVE